MRIENITTNRFTQQRQIKRDYKPAFGTLFGYKLSGALREMAPEIDANTLKILKNIKNNGYDKNYLELNYRPLEPYDDEVTCNFTLNGEPFNKAYEIFSSDELQYRNFRRNNFVYSWNDYDLEDSSNWFEKSRMLYKMQVIRNGSDELPLDKAILKRINAYIRIIERFNIFKKEYPELCLNKAQEIEQAKKLQKDVNNFLDSI